MIREYVYVCYGSYSGTAATMKEAKEMEERFKSLEHGRESLTLCGLENAKSAANNWVNPLYLIGGDLFCVNNGNS